MFVRSTWYRYLPQKKAYHSHPSYYRLSSTWRNSIVIDIAIIAIIIIIIIIIITLNFLFPSCTSYSTYLSDACKIQILFCPGVCSLEYIVATFMQGHSTDLVSVV